MNLNIRTSGKGLVAANCVLGQALQELEKGEGSLMWLGLSKTEIKDARQFCNAMKRAFKAAHRKVK